MNEQKVKTEYKELHDSSAAAQQLNWLRAAVLGANDGIVSISALVLGVAGATSTESTFFIVGMSGLIAGALSMSLGEYVSVSSQRDSERALLEKERYEIENFPEEELEELARIYEGKGLSKATSELVAKELMEHDAFAAHADAEFGIDPDSLTNPVHAAVASALSFFVGGVIPLISILFSPANYRVQFTFLSVLVALLITGSLSGHISGGSKTRATLRVVIGGALAMAITFGIGHLFGVSGL